MEDDIKFECKIPEPQSSFKNYSDPPGWRCHLFGGTEKVPGLVLYPRPEIVPNAFQRWMMKVFFACTWVYKD